MDASTQTDPLRFINKETHSRDDHRTRGENYNNTKDLLTVNLNSIDNISSNTSIRSCALNDNANYNNTHATVQFVNDLLSL